ncbi:MAG: SIMPL domain-containing protein [Deltaproteobacteria bacterium]|nr:SIMPL domain-containing protein [Deltaproteobacteria bacterium]
MLKSTLASLVLATSLVACTDKPAPQVIAVQSPADVVRPGQMTVTGTATLEVSPDCADLTMTLVSDGSRPGIATAGVQAKQEALIQALKKLGVETSDMKLSFMTLNPIYENSPAGWSQLKVRTYRSEITITVTTKKFDKIAAIMEAGAESGVSSMSTQFRRSDLPELKKKVREMALTAARAKAKQTTDTLGIGLGRIVSIAENQGGMMWSNHYFPRVANTMEVSDSAAVVLGGSLQPLTLDVTIGFELASET